MEKNVKIIDKMLKSLGVRTAVALAGKLDVGEATVSSWKKRGVPAKILMRVSEMTGKPIEWFTAESEEVVEKEKPQVPEHIRLLYKEINRVILGENIPIDRQYEITSKVLKLLKEEKQN